MPPWLRPPSPFSGRGGGREREPPWSLVDTADASVRWSLTAAGRSVLAKRTRLCGACVQWGAPAPPWRVGGCPIVRSCMGRPHPLSEEYTVTRHHSLLWSSRTRAGGRSICICAALQGVARQQRASAVPYARGTRGRRPLQAGYSSRLPVCRRPADPTPDSHPCQVFAWAERAAQA